MMHCTESFQLIPEAYRAQIPMDNIFGMKICQSLSDPDCLSFAYYSYIIAGRIKQTILSFVVGSFASWCRYFIIGPEAQSGEMRAGERPRSKAIPRKGKTFGWFKRLQIRASS
jgi:hypothetical protein